MANATEEDQARGEAIIRQQIDSKSGELTRLERIEEQARTASQKSKIEKLKREISELQQRLRNY